jgi:hypothetical protein
MIAMTVFHSVLGMQSASCKLQREAPGLHKDGGLRRPGMDLVEQGHVFPISPISLFKYAQVCRILARIVIKPGIRRYSR